MKRDDHVKNCSPAGACFIEFLFNVDSIEKQEQEAVSGKFRPYFISHNEQCPETFFTVTMTGDSPSAS